MRKNVLDYIEEYFCMTVLAFMTLLIFLQVVLRYFFAYSLSWSEELSRYLFIWLSWVGASYCVKIDAHLRVTALIGLAPKKFLPYINLFMYFCWTLFAMLLVYQGWSLVQLIIERGQASAAMRMPMWIPIASVPVGSALMTFRLFGKIKLTLGEIMNAREATDLD